MLKSFLQMLISKIGVLDTGTFSLITGDAVVPNGLEPKENRLSCVAPFSGYVVATVKCQARVVNLMVNSNTFTQSVTFGMAELIYQSIQAPCSKGDAVEVALLAQTNGPIELKFFAINNGK